MAFPSEYGHDRITQGMGNAEDRTLAPRNAGAGNHGNRGGVRGPGRGDVVRTPLPDGNPFPISAAVTLHAGVDTVYVSGALPAAINKDAPKGTPPEYGDMQTQTVSVLTSIQGTLAGLDSAWAMWSR